MPTLTKKEIENTYDSIAEHFDATRPFPWKEAMDFVKKIPENSLVLDIGCGTGRHVKLLEDNKINAVGLDISQKQLEIAKCKTKSLFVKGDSSVLPFKAERFDFVLNVAALHHLPSPEERLNSLKEIKRILKKNGKAIISAWAFEQERFRDRKKDAIVPWTRQDGKVFERYYYLFDENEFKSIINESGLNVLKYFKSGDNHWAVASKNSF